MTPVDPPVYIGFIFGHLSSLVAVSDLPGDHYPININPPLPWNLTEKPVQCAANEVMTGTQLYVWGPSLDDEHVNPYCTGISDVPLGGGGWVVPANAGTNLVGYKTATCGANQVATGVRIYSVPAIIDDEHVDIYCSNIITGAQVGAPGPWREAANAWLNPAGYKSVTCPAGEAVVGVRWYQWGPGIDDEHVDIQCAPLIPMVLGICGATNNVCTSGTLSDLADDAVNYRWQCLGSGGGSDSPVCTQAKPQSTYTFDGAGATTPPSPTSVTLLDGAPITPPTNPIRTGYTFTNWSPAIPPTMPAGGGTSVAQWAPVLVCNPATSYGSQAACQAATGDTCYMNGTSYDWGRDFAVGNGEFNPPYCLPPASPLFLQQDCPLIVTDQFLGGQSCAVATDVGKPTSWNPCGCDGSIEGWWGQYSCATIADWRCGAPTYTITFDGNTNDGGSTAPQGGITSGATVALTGNGFTKTGYTFNDWNTVSNGSGTSYNNGANFTMPASNVTLYAQWASNCAWSGWDTADVGPPGKCTGVDLRGSVVLPICDTSRNGDYVLGGCSGIYSAWINYCNCTGSPVVAGSCALTHNNCLSGTPANFTEDSSDWAWQCVGSGGGATVGCSEPKPSTFGTPLSAISPVNYNSPSSLTWTASPATSCTLYRDGASQGAVPTSASGFWTGANLTADTTFRVECINGTSPVIQSNTVTVNVRPQITVTGPTPASVVTTVGPGSSMTFSVTPNATQCWWSRGGTGDALGNWIDATPVVGSPWSAMGFTWNVGTYIYSFRCQSAGGAITEVSSGPHTLTVGAPVPAVGLIDPPIGNYDCLSWFIGSTKNCPPPPAPGGIRVGNIGDPGSTLSYTVAVTVNPGVFSCATNCNGGGITPGSHIDIGLLFSPTGPGPTGGQLIITPDVGAPIPVNLVGTGVNPFPPVLHEFGRQVINRTKTTPPTLSVNNDSGLIIPAGTFTLQAGPFECQDAVTGIWGLTCAHNAIPPGNGRPVVNLRFTPSQPIVYSRNATMSVAPSATITITGNGAIGAVEFCEPGPTGACI